MISIRRLLAFLSPALLVAGSPAAARLPDAEPAMWVLKDADTTIYLFGTFHAMDGKRDWFNDEVRQAFDASQDVILEVITPENPADMAPTVMKYAIDPSGRTLMSKLSPEGRKNLAAALKRYHMRPDALDHYQPFFASLTLTTMQFSKMGMGADHGAEAVLRKAIAGTTKRLGAVESIDDQLGLFSALSEAEQVKLLEDSLSGNATLGPEISTMLDAWNRGDAKAVADSIQQSEKDSPALYKLMFTDRNARWVKWLDKRLEQPGTVFMAVGAGHLAGDNSVIGMLKKQGLNVSRVQ